MAYVMASVGTVQLFDPSNNALIVTSKTLSEQSMSFAVTAEEVRGGTGNRLLAKYYHDSAFSLTLTDQLFDLEYLALNCGGSITAGSDVITNEQITITTANTITISQSAVKFNGSLMLWYKKSTDDDSAYTAVVMDSATTATVNGLAVGDVVCVKYFYNADSAREFTISSTFIPSTVYAVMTLPLYKSGTTATSYSSSSQVGEIQIRIPNFQLDGNQEFSLTSSGVSTSSLNGSALATFTSDAGCENNGYYAIISEIIYGKSPVDNIVAIAIENSDIDLASGETATLVVYGIYNDGTTPTVIDNSLLTFTSGTQSVATVSTSGVVTAVASGEAVIEAVITDKPTISANAVVTVA